MAAPKTVVVQTLANATKPAAAVEDANNAKEVAEHTPADTKTKSDAKPNSNPNTLNFINSSEITIGDALNNGLLTRKYRGRWNNMPVTIQKLCINDSRNRDLEFTPQLIYEIEQEVKLMQSLQSPYIFRTLGYSAVNYCIVMEDMTVSHSLNDMHYTKDMVWNWQIRFQMITDMTRGLAYLHERNIVHGDFRSETLGVDKDNHIKIQEFGLEKISMRVNAGFLFGATYMVRPECWWAPELEARRDRIRTKESDVYSLGVTIWEVITGQFPPNALDKVLPTIPPNCPSDMSRLLTFCWKQPNERPTVSEIVAYLDDPKRATYTDKNALIPAKNAAAEAISVDPKTTIAATALPAKK